MANGAYRSGDRGRSGLTGWLGASANRGDSARLEAFSDAVLAIAITLLTLEIHVVERPGQSLAGALVSTGPELLAFGATFLQIGIMWANHHALFAVIDRVDPLLVLANLILLGCVAFLPLPTKLVAEHSTGPDARTALLLYGGVLTGCALAFNLVWWRALRRGLLVRGVSAQFRRDVSWRYLAGLAGYAMATPLAFVGPWWTVGASAVLALLFLLGPSPRSPFSDQPPPSSAVDGQQDPAQVIQRTNRAT
jgi:uncharacterized membrane protein